MFDQILVPDAVSSGAEVFQDHELVLAIDALGILTGHRACNNNESLRSDFDFDFQICSCRLARLSNLHGFRSISLTFPVVIGTRFHLLKVYVTLCLVHRVLWSSGHFAFGGRVFPVSSYDFSYQFVCVYSIAELLSSSWLACINFHENRSLDPYNAFDSSVILKNLAYAPFLDAILFSLNTV